jgi:hypothetical protein
MLPASLVNLIKRKPVLALLGCVGAIFSCFHTIASAVSDAPDVWKKAVAPVLGVPECGSYSEVYYYDKGHFMKIGEKWYDFKDHKAYRFSEIGRGRDPDLSVYYIYLTSDTKHEEDPRWQDARFRLPACGGRAEFNHTEIKGPGTWTPTEPWRPLQDVKRWVGKEEEQTQTKETVRRIEPALIQYPCAASGRLFPVLRG